MLHSFGKGTDGSTPNADLVSVHGTLFGTTEFGGIDDLGSVFDMSPSGAYLKLYSFQGGTDGSHPLGA